MASAPPAPPGPPPPVGGASASRYAHLRARLSLPVARRATGLLDGLHRSVLQGHGQDFDDLSLYTPGDDVGDIDWKSSARAGIPVIKRFVRQSNLTVVLAVDTGRTMAATAASGESKATVVAGAAGLVAYLARDRGDRVALVAADSGRMTQLPPRAGTAHIEVVLRQVERALTVTAPPSDLRRVLERVGALPRRSLVVVLTDEAGPGPEHRDALRTVCMRHEVLVISVADADPLAAPGEGRQTRDVDDGWSVPPWLQGRPDLQEAAARSRAAHAVERATMLRRLRVHDVVVRGTEDVVPGLVDLLARSRRAHR